MLVTKRFTEALTYATELHATQVRKGSDIPYIAHLLGVASIALEYGANEDEAMPLATAEAVSPHFSMMLSKTKVEPLHETAIVHGCTDAHTIPKPPWKQRKEAYIAHLMTASPSVLLVSGSDKLHNARSILKDYRVLGESLWERFQGRKEGTLWYYRQLAITFDLIGKTPLVAELERVVLEIEALALNEGRRKKEEGRRKG
ncbi:MAG: HD domain-containing protein [Cyanomargarita calcarea GSE-NOS-MK-12-04C]|jgi:GTP pyrophosphokinase|uniref:HD domain-containing protein n=1 Tax=Cyanomargarita calcarea GSE-NOS-MK-12-04C TaxID=2839659 RepID=A0A951QTD2_9CYAN|nr:HD domain-containing protein [Cyanomargarita calcarea GSE-NOS-MK-12-04C]